MTVLTAYSYGGLQGTPLINPVIMKRPVMMVTLVVCLVIFAIIRLGGNAGGRTGLPGRADRSKLLSRAVVCGCYDRVRIKKGQWWRILTVGFTHIQGWHIAVNLYSLYALSGLEEVYGHLWFSIILFGSVAGGSILEFLISKTRYSVGLSGGLYGLMFSYALLVWTYGGNIRSLLFTIVVNLAINFAPGIAWQAHVGGALTGLVLTEVMLHLA